MKIYKIGIIWALCLAYKLKGQSDARQHNIISGTQPFVSQSTSAYVHDKTTYTEEDLCSFDGYVLVFNDDFLGNKLDQSVWEANGCNDWMGNQCNTNILDPDNYYVNGGTLNLITTYDHTTGKIVCPSIRTKRQFPAGKVRVIARMPPIAAEHEDISPLWMYTSLNYSQASTSQIALKQNFVNEIDMEYYTGYSKYGFYTLHQGDHNIPGEQSYSDGAPAAATGGLGTSVSNPPDCTDNNWHVFEVDWDMYHVDWLVDGFLVNSLSRTYRPIYLCCGTLPLTPIPLYLEEVDECTGPSPTLPPTPLVIDKDWMFPLYANLPIMIGGLGDYNGLIPDSDVPYTMQIADVQYWRKISCDKDLTLPPDDLNPSGGYRSAGGIGCDGSDGDQVPPTIDNQTPSVIAAGTITVGKNDGTNVPYIFRRDDYDYQTQQNLDLMALKSITLYPGFETDLLYQAIGPCAPRYTGGYLLTNNWTIQDVFTASIIKQEICPGINGESIDKKNLLKRIDSLDENFVFTVYPNPISNEFNVYFILSQPAFVVITISNLIGQDVDILNSGWYEKGNSTLKFNSSNYPQGIYIMHFSDGTNVATKKIIIQHGSY